MKKNFHVYFVFVLLALLASSAWANSGSLKGSTIESSSGGILQVRETDASSPRWFGDFYFNPGDRVTLLVTSGSLRALKIKDASGYDVEYNAFLNVDNKRCYAGAYAVCDSITFTMPSSNVTVTPVFGSDIYYNMPIQGMMSINVPIGTTSFKLYDDGGPSGNYTGGKTAYFEKSLNLVAPEGYCFRLTGSVDLHSMTADFLSVRKGLQSGSSLSYVLLDTYYNKDKVDIIVHSNIVSVSLFAAAGAKSSSGFDLTVTLVKGPYSVSALSDPDGSISFDKTKASNGEIVHVTAQPNEGYFVQQVNVYETGHSGIDDGYFLAWNTDWYNNEGYFNMPDYDVSVRPIFQRISSVLLPALDRNDTIWMKSNATKFVNVPSGVTHFSVVDHAGDCKNDKCKYNDKSQDTMVITVPEGYRMSVSGWVSAEIQYDYLCIYDGDNTSASLMYGKCLSSNNSSGDTTTLSVKKSTSNKMTLYFKSDVNNNYAGFNLKINVEQNKWKIIQKGVVGGNVALESDSALAESKVSLTAKPLNGYMLADIQVKAGESVVNSRRIGFTDDAYFTMPSSDVIVTPTFTNSWTAEGGLYLNMPQTGTTTVSIPDGVKSFKVYDDGGKNGNYADNSNGVLILTAPDGYALQVEGSVDLATYVYSGITYFDYLYIYDGEGTSGTHLGHVNQSSNIRYISSGTSLTLKMRKEHSGTASGFDLTVKVVKYDMELENDGNGGKYVNMLVGNTATLKVPKGITSFKVYDDGGKNGYYASNSDGTLILTAPDGYALQVEGSVDLATYVYSGITYFDYLYIYDGEGTSGTHLGHVNQSSNIRYISSGTSLTLKMKKEHSGTASGLNLTVTLIPVEYTISYNKLLCAVLGTCVLADKSSGYVGDTVLLTAVSDHENFVLEKFVVKDANKNIVPVIRNSLTEAFFVMPASNVQVDQGSFDTEVSADEGFHLDLIRNGKKKIDFPIGVKSFKLYDNGGAFGDYSIYSDDTLVVTAPEGYHFKMTGKIYTEYKNYDKLNVYDGASTTATRLFAQGSITTGVAYDVGIIETSLNSMTVYFHSDRSEVSSGLDLLVSIEPDSYAITIAEVDNGSVSSNVATATAGEKVTLIATPDEFAVLSSISVVDASSNVVSVTKVDDVTYTFKMPNTNVTVTPIFVEIPTISVVQVENGTLESDINHALAGETVTLTAKPAKGYLIDGVVVKDADNKKVTLNNDIYWYSGTNEVSFKMPAKAVTVTPKFSPIDNLSIVKAAGEIEVNIPENVTSFKIYDDGGPDGDYNYVSGPLWVKYDKNSNGVGLKLSGTVSAKEGVFLEIYAYENKNTLKPFYTYDGSSENVGPFINASSIMIDFETMSAESAAGLDLRVDVVEALGGGVEVAYDDALLMNDYFKRWATITDGVKTSALNITDDIAVDGVSLSREFKTGDFYNTIVFPFDVKADNLGGVQKVLRFNGFKQLEDQSWAVRMKRVWTTDSVGKGIGINAYYPYLVVMNTKTMGVSGRVTLRKTVEPIAMADGSNWTFHGTLAYMDMPEGNPNVYGFQDNKFVRAGEGSFVNPLRAYLLKPAPQQSNGRPSVDGKVYARTMTASVEDTPDEFYIVEDDDENGEHTTIIGRYNVRTGEFKMLRNYDLKGRKLNGKPNAHKAYYGKKVINK